MKLMERAANLEQKGARLREIVASHPGLIVAYSGGVDSAFLAWTARHVLGDQMVAVIADSASLARTHLEDAVAFAHEHAIPVEVVETRELENPAYARRIVTRIRRILQFPRLNYFNRNRVFVGKGDRVLKVRPCQAGGIRNDCDHLIAQYLARRPRQKCRVNTARVSHDQTWIRRYNLAQPCRLLLEVRRSLHELHFTWNPLPRAVLLVESFLPPQVAEGPDVRQREAETIHVLIA